MTAPRLVATDLDGTLLLDLPRDDVLLAMPAAPVREAVAAWAARSFAVGETHPSVVAAATDRAGSNDDDGGARTLETVLGV